MSRDYRRNMDAKENFESHYVFQKCPKLMLTLILELNELQIICLWILLRHKGHEKFHRKDEL